MKNLTPWFLIFLLAPFSLGAATFSVTNTNDAGAGSLRQVLMDANSTAGNDTIGFNLGSVTAATITLQSALPAISDSVTIDGPVETTVTIDANGTGTVFIIDSPVNNQTVAMSRLIIKGGHSGGLEGGGIFVGMGDTFNLTDASVESNSAGNGLGGGIYSDGTTSLTGVSIVGNTAGLDGGGIYVGSGSVMVTNSTISGNSADRDGGGVFYGDGIISLNNVTITNNTASNDFPANNVGDGGGIAGGSVIITGSIKVINSIVAGNVDKDNGDNGNCLFAPDCSTIMTPIYSLIGMMNSCSFSSAQNSIIGSSLSPKDPKLSVLANNGGFARTHSLQAGSLAIDAANKSTEGNNLCASSDQRSFSRPQDGDANGLSACDMGAFEVGCGDSVVQGGAGEECDDGNTDENDACTNVCKNARCGDGIIGPGEICDDGNTVSTDVCTNSCQAAMCGDGSLGPNEECDDGNITNEDGCNGSCKKEAPAAAASDPSSASTNAPSNGPSAETGTSETANPSASNGPSAETDTPEAPTSGGGCALLPSGVGKFLHKTNSGG